MILAKTQAIPLRTDSDGVIRVGGTRVRLETVVYAFNEGYTAEEIISQYPALDLPDVYAILAYYLNNRTMIEDYIRQRAEAAANIRQEIEARPEYKSFRERLLARRQKQQPNLVK